MYKFLSLLVLTVLFTACGGGTTTPPKINSFIATPTNLPVGGGSTQLQWDVSGATTLSINQGVGSVSPTDKGSKGVNVTASQTFTLTAANSTGTVTKDVIITVAIAPSISINPTSRAFVAGDPGGSFDANVQGSTGTINWNLTGPGSLGSNTGSTVIYNPPPSVTSLSTATLTASVSGTSLTASATISIAPTVLTGGVLFYQSDGSGEVGSLSNTGDFSPIKSYAAGELPTGITHFGKPYEIYELLYSAADGSGALGTFDGAGTFRKLRTYAVGDLPVGQNHLISLNDRVVFYKAATGTTLCGNYGNNYDFSNPVTQTGYSTDWSLIVRANDSNGVQFYRQSDGLAGYGTYNASCKWTFISLTPGYSTGWSFMLKTPNGVLFYRKSDGVGALLTYAADGKGTQIGTYIGKIPKNYQQVIYTKFGVLFYNSDGSGELATFSGNTYTKVKAYVAGDLPLDATVAAIGN